MELRLCLSVVQSLTWRTTNALYHYCCCFGGRSFDGSCTNPAGNFAIGRSGLWQPTLLLLVIVTKS